MSSPLEQTPPPDTVNRFHSNCDCDQSVVSQHHTLGIQAAQASPGDHTHDGKSSKRIGRGLDPLFPSVAGVSYSQAQMQSVIDALRDLGFGS